MQHHPYPSDWKLRAHACLAQVGYRCEDCAIPHGVLRVGRGSQSPYVIYLHATHVNHDPENPQAQLWALCPSCHMKHDRRTERKRIAAHKQGYHIVSTTRLVIEVRSAGLHSTQAADGYTWQIGERTGRATDVLDASASALHCLCMERVEVSA